MTKKKREVCRHCGRPIMFARHGYRHLNGGWGTKTQTKPCGRPAEPATGSRLAELPGQRKLKLKRRKKATS